VAEGGAFSPDSRTLGSGSPAYTLRLRDSQTGRIFSTLVQLRQGDLLVSADGHYRATAAVEAELVCVVQTDAGLEALAPAEFARRYHWKNDPNQARALIP
jgi:hypothetical protein